MRKVFLASLLLPLATFLFRASDGVAQQLTDSGYAFYTPADHETTELPDGKLVQNIKAGGFVVSTSDEALFGPSIQTCAGTIVVFANAPNPTYEGHGYCDAVDNDGDIWWMWWAENPEGIRWGLTGGTGKYEGVDASGTSTRVAEWHDGRNMLHWEATWSKQ